MNDTEEDGARTLVDIDGDGHTDAVSLTSVAFADGHGKMLSYARFDIADSWLHPYIGDIGGSPAKDIIARSFQGVLALLITGSGSAGTLSSAQALSAIPPQSRFGFVQLFTTVVSSPELIVPRGAVLFSDDRGPFALVALSASGVASAFDDFPVGTHTLTTTYLGDEHYAAAQQQMTVDTLRAVSVFNYTINRLSAKSGQSFVIRIATEPLLSSSFTARSGNITILEGTRLIATAPANSSPTFTIGDLPPGTHTLTVTYPGDSNYEPAKPLTLTVTVLALKRRAV